MVDQKPLSIRQLAQIAKVSVRTLHYYDQICLLRPPRQEGNSYRSYDTSSVLRLQQILFYKEMGFDLERIKAILEKPGFDCFSALTQHKQSLLGKMEQTQRLIQTIDRTIDELKGNLTMSNNEFFNGFSDEQQAEYEKEAADKWNPEVVRESNLRWKALSNIEKQELLKKQELITLALRDVMLEDPASEKVQNLVQEHRDHINFFYDCTPQILLGLGHLYIDDPRFHATYAKVDSGLAEFFFEAIRIYCERLGVID